jgi:hypothetical protein
MLITHALSSRLLHTRLSDLWSLTARLSPLVSHLSSLTSPRALPLCSHYVTDCHYLAHLSLKSVSSLAFMYLYDSSIYDTCMTPHTREGSCETGSIPAPLFMTPLFTPLLLHPLSMTPPL